MFLFLLGPTFLSTDRDVLIFILGTSFLIADRDVIIFIRAHFSMCRFWILGGYCCSKYQAGLFLFFQRSNILKCRSGCSYFLKYRECLFLFFPRGNFVNTAIYQTLNCSRLYPRQFIGL